MKDTSRAWSQLLQFREAACLFFKEREDLVECGLVALLSDSHLFILGPPGTAKSMLAEALAGSIAGARYFYALMHKFLTWRDLACGQVVVREEVSGSGKSITFRNTEGPMLLAQFLFLDELFKASAATNNSLLNLFQERVYSINAGEVFRSPLMMAVAASNEMPGSGDDQLRPFADRFLIWYEVDYISVSHGSNTAFLDMLEGTGAPPTSGLTLEDVFYLRSEARQVTIDRALLGLINSIRATLRHEFRIQPSDRRFRASLSAIRAYAYLSGRVRATVADLAILEHILWAGREREVRDTVRRVVREFSGEEALTTIEDLFRRAKEIYADALSLADRADKEIPMDQERRKKRDDLRDQALAKGRELDQVAAEIAAALAGATTRRGTALGRCFLNETNALRKALVARRGVEDPFAGVSVVA